MNEENKKKSLSRSASPKLESTSYIIQDSSLLTELRELISQTQAEVARTVNSTLVQLYWQVGTRIRTELLKNERAEYGKQICVSVSHKLAAEFGSGFSSPNLWKMLLFAELYPDGQILLTLSRKLTWSHFVELLRVKQPLAREFYAEMCRVENWSVRTLRAKIQGMLFERTAISKKPDELIRQELAELCDRDTLTPNLVFRDPYFLDFLGLKDTYSERDLEQAILRELEAFILELGTGFAFVGRQVRIVIDGEDFYLDLLFYHRKLRRLVVIDLKLGEFQAADKGQMELYLRWLEKHETEPGEQSPLGMILCAGQSREKVELLQLDASGIHVATYLTELPPIEVLQAKLHQALRDARRVLEQRAEYAAGERMKVE
jgi:predicted nuclease of restriction endonuclease-like (RecB) superfamily